MGAKFFVAVGQIAVGLVVGNLMSKGVNAAENQVKKVLKKKKES